MSSNNSEFPTHDWGMFGQYEYLGPGTPYVEKREAGISGINILDQQAMRHDAQYEATDGLTMPGIRSHVRGVADIGSGSSMLISSVNPWSSADTSERILSAAAGAALLAQGTLRLAPQTRLMMVVLDRIFY